jgi:hypothetical protein
VKFRSVSHARRAIWERLLTEIAHLEDLGALKDECEDEFDALRMGRAVAQVRASIKRRIRRL